MAQQRRAKIPAATPVRANLPAPEDRARLTVGLVKLEMAQGWEDRAFVLTRLLGLQRDGLAVELIRHALKIGADLAEERIEELEEDVEEERRSRAEAQETELELAEVEEDYARLIERARAAGLVVETREPAEETPE